MGQRYALVENLYLQPTPGGAYHAVSSADANPSRRLLCGLLKHRVTPPVTLDGVMRWSGMNDQEKALEMLYHAQSLGWIQGLEQQRTCSEDPLESVLPDLLKSVSNKGKALLSDSQGFHLASSGFAHEVAEELSALAAEVSKLHERRSGLLLNNMGLNSSAWGVVDAAGNSKLGFWPMAIGRNKFVLVVAGVPQLNQPNFVDLVWMLCTRYSTDVLVGESDGG